MQTGLFPRRKYLNGTGFPFPSGSSWPVVLTTYQLVELCNSYKRRGWPGYGPFILRHISDKFLHFNAQVYSAYVACLACLAYLHALAVKTAGKDVAGRVMVLLYSDIFSTNSYTSTVQVNFAYLIYLHATLADETA